MINNILLGVFDEDMLYVTTTITPITEEIVKALPILYCAVVITDERSRWAWDSPFWRT